MTGDDAMTQSALADFDVGAERARRQQIEDLQRFGVLGGSGVSSGAVADILCEFDAATQRGRAGVRAQGLNRVLQYILPQAAGMAQQQAALAQQQAQFGERQGLAEAGLTGRLGEEDTLAAQQLAQQQEQFELAQDLAREKATGQIRTGTGGMGEAITRRTIQQQQLDQQAEL